MHFLLIPYFILCATFALQFSERRKLLGRTGAFVVAVATALLMFAAMVFRPVQGDSWRYYQHFLRLREQSLSRALSTPDSDPLFLALMWLVGQVGSAPILLFFATLLVYFSVFFLAIKRSTGLIELTVLTMCYSAYPFFVAYGASGLRQGLALAFLFMAYSHLRDKKWQGWLWLFLAPLWHSGAWLAVPITIVHQLMCATILRERTRWLSVFIAFTFAVVLSATGFNEIVMSRLAQFVKLNPGHDIYFSDPDIVNYRSGFRADFFLFSLIPLLTAWLLRKRSRAFAYDGPGWWLSLYLSLNIIYHLFAFAPFADRFAAFSWFLMPFVVCLQIARSGDRNLLTLFVLGVSLVNVVMLQFYTGNFIGVPRWW